MINIIFICNNVKKTLIKKSTVSKIAKFWIKNRSTLLAFTFASGSNYGLKISLSLNAEFFGTPFNTKGEYLTGFIFYMALEKPLPYMGVAMWPAEKEIYISQRPLQMEWLMRFKWTRCRKVFRQVIKRTWLTKNKQTNKKLVKYVRWLVFH